MAFGSLFLLATSIEMLRRLPQVNGSPIFLRAYIFLLAHHLYHLLAFYTIFSDLRESFSLFNIKLTIIIAILNASRDSRDSGNKIERPRGVELSC